MSPSNKFREEIREEWGSVSERQPPSYIRRENWSDTQRNVSPQLKEERGEKVMERKRKGRRGSCPQLEGKWGSERPTEGQSDFINHRRQLRERQEGKCRVRTGGTLWSLLLNTVLFLLLFGTLGSFRSKRFSRFNTADLLSEVAGDRLAPKKK